jgi:hypothetical protein
MVASFFQNKTLKVFNRCFFLGGKMKKLLALLVCLFASNLFAETCTYIMKDYYGSEVQRFTRFSYSYNAACDEAQYDCKQDLAERQVRGGAYGLVCQELYSPSYPTPNPGPSYPTPYPGPSYPTPYPGPSYPTPYPGPSYPTPYPGPSYPTPYPGPSYPHPLPPRDPHWPDHGPERDPRWPDHGRDGGDRGGPGRDPRMPDHGGRR